VLLNVYVRFMQTALSGWFREYSLVQPVVWSRIRNPLESRIWQSDSGHVLLLDSTLSLILHGVGWWTVLAGSATSSMACHHATPLPHI